MAVLVEIKHACKRYGEQVLLDGATATLSDDGRVGFIGRNGAGKSTLLRLILGEEELDSGEIVRHPRLRAGYLRQHDPFLAGESALDFLRRDSGRAAWRCGEVAGRFGLKGRRLEGPVADLSGGWQTRVKLAALLLHEPNLLLLDEPTNFLDLRTQLLLEQFLRGFREACLIVSHDRAFLAATCDQTLDLSAGTLTLFPGPVDAFLEHRLEVAAHRERTGAATLARRRQLEDFIARNRARASTASRARSKARQLERLQLDEGDAIEATAVIRCPSVARRRGAAVRCRGLAVGYPSHAVAAGIDLEIEHGSRAAIVGDNGQGKTTFVRTLVGSLPPLAGELRWGHGCEVGVYAQHVFAALREDQTVLDHLERAAAPGIGQQHVLDVAGALLFRGVAIGKRVGVLSGGERARLCLAGLLLGTYNVLVLDEPVNHLDVETIEALSRALVAYDGTVVFTSHDRGFMRAVATTVIEVRDGRVVDTHGDPAGYLAAVTGELADADGPAGRRGAAADRRRPQPAARGPRDVRREIAAVEKSIDRLDAERRAADAALLRSTDADEAVRLHAELTAAAARLAAAEERWLALQEELSRVEG